MGTIRNVIVEATIGIVCAVAGAFLDVLWGFHEVIHPVVSIFESFLGEEAGPFVVGLIIFALTFLIVALLLRWLRRDREEEEEVPAEEKTRDSNSLRLAAILAILVLLIGLIFEAVLALNGVTGQPIVIGLIMFVAVLGFMLLMALIFRK
jgi:hypothetical protein